MSASPLFPVTIPVLETERLLLRGHRIGDFADCLALWTDPEVTRFIGGKPSSQEEVWGRVVRYVGHWALLGFGYWAIEDKASGRFVGEIGFADFKRVIEPSLDGVPEVGWALAPHVHGRGYATEALRTVVRWGDRQFGPVRTACIIAPENTPSIRVAEKCGYRELCRTTYKDNPTIMFAREGPRAISGKAGTGFPSEMATDRRLPERIAIPSERNPL